MAAPIPLTTALRAVCVTVYVRAGCPTPPLALPGGGVDLGGWAGRNRCLSFRVGGLNGGTGRLFSWWPVRFGFLGLDGFPGGAPLGLVGYLVGLALVFSGVG